MTDERGAIEYDLPVPWERLREAFEFDGSLHDIYVLETDLATWERVLAWIRELEATGTAHLKSEPDPLPRTVAQIMAGREVTGIGVLYIYVGGLQINCHFFTDDEIEFDIDPREVKGPAEARVVLDFMRGLGDIADGPVHLTEENRSDQRWLTYDPRSGKWRFLPKGLSGT